MRLEITEPAERDVVEHSRLLLKSEGQGSAVSVKSRNNIGEESLLQCSNGVTSPLLGYTKGEMYMVFVLDEKGLQLKLIYTA